MNIPYISSGQQLGETRQAMTRDIMQKDLEPLINKLKHKREKYYILIHAKKVPGNESVIWKKIIVTDNRPPMMLSCLLFGVDNVTGKLTLEWSLPGSWPTWAVGGTNEPIPEVVASLNELGKVCDLDKVIAY